METEKNNSRLSMAWKTLYSDYSVILVTLVVIILAAVLEGEYFFTVQNFLNIIRNNAVVGIIALGMAFVIISGEIDLSVGSQLVAVGAVTLYVINSTGNIVLGVVAALAMGIVTSIITGIIVAYGKVPSFIVTLGMMNIYRSICMYAMKGGGFYGEAEAYAKIANGELAGGIPLPIIYLFIMLLVCWYISRHTKMGRHIYAAGSNQKATRLSGINVNFVKIKAFAMLGLTVAVAAIIETSRMNSINASSSGTSYELNAIAMAVIGGISMSGGKGSIINTFFGMLILGIINNILTLMGVDVYLVAAIKGAIIILSVLLQKKENER